MQGHSPPILVFVRSPGKWPVDMRANRGDRHWQLPRVELVSVATVSRLVENPYESGNFAGSSLIKKGPAASKRSILVVFTIGKYAVVELQLAPASLVEY